MSLASESGRVAFVPISRGSEFFDRFAHADEGETVSPTSWNEYSIGALQCAMTLDIAKVDVNEKPEMYRFTAKTDSDTNPIIEFEQPTVTGIEGSLPPEFIQVANENQSYDFGSDVVDVAYGADGKFYFETGVTGNVAFNNDRFEDPVVGVFKAGYYRPSPPFGITQINNLGASRWCIQLFPERLPDFLESIGASDTTINHSIVVNVDYTTTGIGNTDFNPIDQSTGQYRNELSGGLLNYGLIINECADLSPFTKGFSLVSNLRAYIGDDFNTVLLPDDKLPPQYDKAVYGDLYPPTSLYAPRKMVWRG